MRQPKIWTPAELARDAAIAKEAFRRQRLEEPLELYTRFFDAFAVVFRALIARLPALQDDAGELSGILSDADARTAFRYLGAPPISEDDLKTLAETRLSPVVLQTRPEEAERIRDTVLHIIDPYRFPWVKAKRPPSGHEIEQAVISSAALVSARKVETYRRGDAKKTQEGGVRSLLLNMGMRDVESRDMPLLDDAPQPGEFCGESKLGDTRADLVVGLMDRRIMPIECKVSNSEVNSFKRVNHEAAGKAKVWLRSFGLRAIVPAAVLSGVFKATNLVTAQGEGLAIFWQHRLDDLREFIEASGR